MKKGPALHPKRRALLPFSRRRRLLVTAFGPLRKLGASAKSPHVKYDDASWHYGGDFPARLPPNAGATHIAIFVAWAVLNGLAGEYHTKDAADDLALLKRRDVTPTQWFIRVCDEKFTNEDLNEEGNSFASSYYGNGEGLRSSDGSYLDDYCDAFPRAASLYDMDDSWSSFEVLAPRLSSRLEAWRGSQS